MIQGCSSTPITSTSSTLQQPPNWQATIDHVLSIEDWAFTGKIGVRVPESIDSAVINRWQQQGSQFTIDLSSAIFGLGATRIEGSPERITITESGEEPITSYNPEQLINQHVGWPLPISQLRYWIKGIPAPSTNPADQVEKMRFNDKGQLSELNQSGWKVRYPRYTQLNTKNHSLKETSLPGKIVLQQAQVKITVIVNEWLLP
jgi:outer membrane lipoprotein LolB